ncbi:hypothetical protein [Rhizobium tumorigenes]|uniref:Uncharacterized protein n=1 Tax=Rhizobium tumorigenes TaxID=2041385 RepID=A0AAF1KAT3_9HYPH|nr:hypothetical protein [Rhizobium tumorigenes]WFR98795.1 hypothetical protein PR017_24175 [Rhizobium tumorigenes]
MITDPLHDPFWHALERFAEGYAQGLFEGRKWGVTVNRSADRKRVWFYAEDLAGSDIVSFNLYRLNDARLALKPCEMSSQKVVAFVLGFVTGPSASTAAL